MNHAVKTSALTLIAATVLGAISAVASAHGGNDDPNVVHACIGGDSQIVRIVGVSGSCRPAETPAHWDIQGAPGIDGTNGTNGIDGTSVTFVDYFSGSAGGCTNGGVIYAAGNPAVHAYVCNGTNGIDGKDGKDGVDAARADGPCFDDFNRYVDCGNGTVTDTVTGLIWLKQWNCLPPSRWGPAQQLAAGLKSGDCGLTDNSSGGDWRLPTKDEWTATRSLAVGLICFDPGLTNDAGTGCYGSGSTSSFPSVVGSDTLGLSTFWSSTTAADNPSFAWYMHGLGDVLTRTKFTFPLPTVRPWPVRGGAR